MPFRVAPQPADTGRQCHREAHPAAQNEPAGDGAQRIRKDLRRPKAGGTAGNPAPDRGRFPFHRKWLERA